MLITTSKKFDKRIKKQPKRIQEEFKKRIELFIHDIYHPTLNIHKLSGKLSGLWSFNLSGDMRVVFDKSMNDVILLVDVGSHSELYS